MSEEIEVLHLASHARAGETMVLRALAAHPQLHVPTQVERVDSQEGSAFVQEVMRKELLSIPQEHPYVVAAGLRPGDRILIKQGTWSPQRFDGIVLVRNPYSFVESMLRYNRREGLGEGVSRSTYARTFERLERWSSAMSGPLFDRIARSADVVDALCEFYSFRVDWLATRGLDIFRYEDISLSPESQLRRMCEALGAPFASPMLEAHITRSGMGHGMNDLGRPIDHHSLERWRDLPAAVREATFERCSATASTVGYALTPDEVELL